MLCIVWGDCMLDLCVGGGLLGPCPQGMYHSTFTGVSLLPRF